MQNLQIKSGRGAKSAFFRVCCPYALRLFAWRAKPGLAGARISFHPPGRRSSLAEKFKTTNMNKILYLTIAPLLLIDACSSARLEKKDTTVEPTANARVVRATESRNHPQRTILIKYSETENDGFILSRRFAEQIDQSIQNRIKAHH